MSLCRALIASELAPSTGDLLAAHVALRKAPSNYTETPERYAMRQVFDAAASTGSIIKVGFLRQDGSLRYMVCRPCVEIDPTFKYYTVEDVELSRERNAPVYRRVCLDTVASLCLEFKANCHTIDQ